ncbi:MAG TPA: MFS transporter [Casimicrobiaceae bacterium]|nr:MFS transporter [Casimicrobiaceae bacterium]
MPSPPSSARTAAIALAATLAIQVFTSLAGTATAVVAPEIARDFSLPAKLVGVFVGLLYVGSMASSLASGHFIARHGAIRVSQVCVLICAAGITLIALLPPGAAPMLALAPIVIGLGYGAITPASSEVLSRTAPPGRLALTFSIKQTGVPAGAALAGAALPPLALTVGWRPAFFLAAGLGVAIAALAQSTRRRLDIRGPERPFSLAALFAPLRVLIQHRTLIELSIVGFVYAAMQMCLMSFLVVYLTEAVGYPLIRAGLALTTANLGGIVGRIVWGAVADHWVAPRRLLGMIGIASAACALATATFNPAWPLAASLAVAAFFGATGIGWNGVQLSDVARHAPAGQAGTITGASGFITFAGVVSGPPLFALLAAITDSYRTGFLVFGAACLICGGALLRTSQSRPGLS